MKQLTCEMCGSTEMVKDGGFFVCQTCGTKYSVEEAKKMMIEGTVDVQGTVRVENQSNVDGLMRIAKTAFESENYEKAIDKCDEIISMSSNNYDAWKLKADALVNVSTKSGNPGLEAYNSLMNAFRSLNGNATDYQKEDIAKTYLKLVVPETLRSLGLVLTEEIIKSLENLCTRGENLLTELNFPEEKKKSYKTSLITSLINTYCIKCNEGIEQIEQNYYGSATEDVREYLKNCLDNYEYPDWGTIDYAQRNRDISESLPDYSVWEAVVNVYERELMVSKFCIQQIDDSINSNTVFDLYRSILYMCAHLYVANPYEIVERQRYSPTDQRYYTELEITNVYDETGRITNVYEEYRELYSTYKNTMVAEVRKRRLNEYLSEHAVEKEQLDAKKAELENEISLLQEKKKEFEKADEILSLVKQVDKLTAEKKSLGLFKGKQKKALQAQIDELNKKREEYWNRDNISSVLNELEEATVQLENVIEQLTMDR